jgi:hypothetical protein
LNEYTLVKTVPGLPQRWIWYADANVVGLAPCVDTPEKRSEALAEVYAHWRRSCIQVVSDEPSIESLPTNHVATDDDAWLLTVGG